MINESGNTKPASSGSDSDSADDDRDKENRDRKRRKMKDPADAIHQSKHHCQGKKGVTQLLEAIKKLHEENCHECEADRHERIKRDNLLIQTFKESCEAQCEAQKEMILLLADSLKENQ